MIHHSVIVLDPNFTKFTGLMPKIPNLVSQMKSTVPNEAARRLPLLALVDEEGKKKAHAFPLEIICNVLDKLVNAFVEWADASSSVSLDVRFSVDLYDQSTSLINHIAGLHRFEYG